MTHIHKHNTLKEVFDEIEKWHEDHPCKSRWIGLRARVKEAANYVRREPKWRWQRARRGYSTRDWWSFDTYICGVIAKACEDFRDHGIGYPGDLTEEEWAEILTRIIEPLKAYSSDKFEVSSYEEDMARHEAAKTAMHLFAENLGGMWD